MTTNALVPLSPRFFYHQVTPQFFLIPTHREHTETLVLTRTNHSAPNPVDRPPVHPIPFWNRNRLHKSTLPAHDFFFDDAQYHSDYGDQKASTRYTNVQGLSDTYDRDGLLNVSPLVKGLYVNLYL